MTITIGPNKLGARIQSDSQGLPKVLQRAIFSGAQRGRSFIIGKSPVDRGLLKNAWRVVKMPWGTSLINDQPYAGVMEQGARPFKISGAGIFYLKAWVMRKLMSGEMNGRSSLIGWNHLVAKYTGRSKTMKRRKTVKLEAQAESIAWAIAKTFEKVGIKGRRFVYMNLPKLAELMDAEINRSLDSFFNRTSGSGQ